MSVATTTVTRRNRPSEAGDKFEGTSGQGKRQDFFWAYTEEPHRSRRQAIIRAHPEVTKLCGPEPKTKYLVLAVVAFQIFCVYALRFTPIFSWTFFLTAYIIGGTANQNLFLAIHEISHNLAFRSPRANRLLAIFANLPIGIPYSATFRPYHLTHHKAQGVDGLDVDIPTKVEAIFLDSVLGKAFFATFQILFYALRPMFIWSVPMGGVLLLNIAVQVAFDALMLGTLGIQALVYFILSDFFAGSLHPCAGHFIAEHYIFTDKETLSGRAPSQDHKHEAFSPAETYSYYGPLNILTYNVGLHNEHHDFPAVPWTRLNKLHEIAREFYEDLPCHKSWVLVMWQFVLDDRVGLWCRVKRNEGGKKVTGSWDQGE